MMAFPHLHPILILIVFGAAIIAGWLEYRMRLDWHALAVRHLETLTGAHDRPEVASGDNDGRESALNTIRANFTPLP